MVNVSSAAAIRIRMKGPVLRIRGNMKQSSLNAQYMYLLDLKME